MYKIEQKLALTLLLELNVQAWSLAEATPPVCDACQAIWHTMSSGKCCSRGRAMVTMGCGRIGDDRAGCSGVTAEGHRVAKRIAGFGLKTPSSLAYMRSVNCCPILQR